MYYIKATLIRTDSEVWASSKNGKSFATPDISECEPYSLEKARTLIQLWQGNRFFKDWTIVSQDEVEFFGLLWYKNIEVKTGGMNHG